MAITILYYLSNLWISSRNTLKYLICTNRKVLQCPTEVEATGLGIIVAVLLHLQARVSAENNQNVLIISDYILSCSINLVMTKKFLEIAIQYNRFIGIKDKVPDYTAEKQR